MKVKEAKEVVVARISTKQAVIVAVISLFSAVAVAYIGNFDKLKGTNEQVDEEVGYYVARAGNVERALHEKEEELQEQSASARQSGNLEEASQLMALADEVRVEDEKFRERHGKHLEAIRTGKRLDASEIKTEANEALTKLNQRLWIYDINPDSGFVRALSEKDVEPFQRDGRKIIHIWGHSISPQGGIPLYGKGVMQDPEEICEGKKIEERGMGEHTQATGD